MLHEMLVAEVLLNDRLELIFQKRSLRTFVHGAVHALVKVNRLIKF